MSSGSMPSGSGTLWANTNLYVGGRLIIDGATLGVSLQTYVAGNSVTIEKSGALLLDGGTVVSDTLNAGRIAGTGTIVGNLSNFGDVVPSVAAILSLIHNPGEKQGAAPSCAASCVTR